MMAERPRWVVLSDGARPTEDIYFLRSAGQWLGEQGAEVRRLDTRRWKHPRWCWPWLERYLAGANVIVCRTLAPAWLDALEQQRSRLAGCYYLIDDDLAAAAADVRLPAGYRQRMALHAARQPRLLALVDEVVACCVPLVEGMRTRHPRVSLLEPPLLAPLPSLEHFASSAWRQGFHGTRAHLHDLEQIGPALASAHDQYGALSFEIMLGRFTPDSLRGLERVTSPSPLAWKHFLAYQRRTRFHIGVAPLWPTAFNRGKSHIKFLDIAAMGGVGIFSHRSPYADIVSHGEDGLLVEDDPQAWLAAIDELMASPERTREMAHRAGQKASARGDITKTRSFWSQRTKR